MALIILRCRHHLPYILFLWSMASWPSFALSDTRQDVAELMAAVRTGAEVDNSKVMKAPAPEVLTALRSHASDRSRPVRLHAVALAIELGTMSPELGFRQQVTNHIVAVAVSYPDKDTGIGRWALTALQRFSPPDFTEQSRQAVSKLLDAAHPSSEALLLAGALELRAKKARLLELMRDVDETGPWWARRSWSARLALARMGDKDQIQYVIQKIEAESDSVVRVTQLKNLAYLRQPLAVEVLVRYLLSDEVLPELYGQSVPIAQYALDVLAQIIPGFPLPGRGSPIYTEDELKTARDWVKSHTLTF
jgi:hypothetical protein